MFPAARRAVNKDETPAKFRTGSRTAKTPEASSSSSSSSPAAAAARRGPKRAPPSSAHNDDLPPAPARPGTWRSLSLAKSSGGDRENDDSGSWERHAVSKSQFRSLTAKKNQPKVAITGAAKSLSDQALHSGNMSINYK